MSRLKISVPLLTLAYGLAAASGFLLSITIGRMLGAGALGSYAVATSIARVFYAATDLGAPTHLTRCVARNPGNANYYTSLFTTYRLLTVPLGTLVVVLGGTGFAGYDLIVFAAIAGVQATVALQAIFESLSNAHQRQTSNAMITMSCALLVASACGLWMIWPGGLRSLCGMYLGASILGAIAWWYWTVTALKVRPSMHVSLRALKVELSASWRIGISVVLGILSLRAPVLVLGVYTNAETVGAFACVDMFVSATAILQNAVTSSAFPRLASTYGSAPSTFRRVLVTTNGLLLLAGLLFGLFMAVFGTAVVTHLFPDRAVAEMSGVIPVLCFSAPGLLLIHHNIFVFAATNHERQNLTVMAAFCLTILALQLVLVPLYGITGACWGTFLGRWFGALVTAAVAQRLKIYGGGRSD